MKFITVIEIAVGILGAIAVAAIAPPAFADDNPYTPEPAASTETADHGHGSYCSKVPFIGTCALEISDRNGRGENTKNDRIGKHNNPPAPKKI